ncbi:MAG: FkbM family methyltransferase [Candidatus Rokuibacteriota bacterium]
MARRLIRIVRPSSRNDLERLARRLVSRPATRWCMNAVYDRLSLARKKAFYARFAKMFRGQPQDIAPGEWRVNIAGRRAILPLDGRDTWLEWDLAVSMLGHETEIKRTYLDLLRVRRPGLFLDIGANYGLHSLFFLVHGVPTVSFEPNPHCHGYFRKLADRNRVRADIRPLALGAEEGWAEICFRESETWLGSSSPAVKAQLTAGHGAVIGIRAAQTTLDAFVKHDGRRPGLIKIDTEGNEAAVLEGGRDTLRHVRPWVIFESWHDDSRELLYELFEQVGYQISPLPFQEERSRTVLDRAALAAWPETNFMARPIEDASAQ